MKKYLLSKITQVSFFVGIVLMISAFIVPRSYIFSLGALLFLINDELLKGWVARWAPTLSAKIEELSK